jgi:glutaredoxin-related protein
MQATRETIAQAQIHPAISEKIATYRKEEIEAVKALVAANRVVVVGMSQNVFPKRARKLLDEKGIAYEYLGIGSYFGEWRRRLVLKMWTGWPTFPLIFVDGVFIGGFDDLKLLVDSGELSRTLSAPRANQ